MIIEAFLWTFFGTFTALHVILYIKGYRLFPKKYVHELIDRVWDLIKEQGSWGTGDEELQESYEMQILSLQEDIEGRIRERVGLEEKIRDLKEEAETYQQAIAGYQEEVFFHRMNCLPTYRNTLTLGEKSE